MAGFVLNKTKGRGSCGIAIYKGSTTRLYNFMLNDQTMDYLTTFLSVLFQIILFSSFILIDIKMNNLKTIRKALLKFEKEVRSIFH
jgi:hypothetical protein